jgi:uncharacterized protein YkwD
VGRVKRTLVVVISVLVAGAAAVGASIATPESALAASGGYVEQCGGGEIFLNEREKKTFDLHNEIRTERNLPTFCVHPQLQKAARAHSKDMIRRDYFSHNTKGRGSFDKRLVRFGYGPNGYDFYRVGENIALGSGPAGEPQNRMHAWMKSGGHRHNILNESYREVGIGTHTGKFKRFDGVTMYTVDFGVRRK